MFKKILIIYAILTCLYSCNNSGENLKTENKDNSRDTLIISKDLIDSVEIQDGYADWPFVDSIIDSKYFINKIGKKAKFTQSLTENINEPNIIDTIRIIEWDSSYVETICNIYTKTEYINTVRINDTSFVFKNSIKVGMPEEIIFKIFKKEYNRDKIYKYFLLTYGDAAENYVIFYFKNKLVKYIVYSPYTG